MADQIAGISILTCPFCREYPTTFTDDDSSASIDCENEKCGALCSVYEDSAEKAAAVWNRRVIPPSESLNTFVRILRIRMNNHLGKMKPEHDDSIVGFNEAQDIVSALAREMKVSA